MPRSCGKENVGLKTTTPRTPLTPPPTACTITSTSRRPIRARLSSALSARHARLYHVRRPRTAHRCHGSTKAMTRTRTYLILTNQTTSMACLILEQATPTDGLLEMLLGRPQCTETVSFKEKGKEKCEPVWPSRGISVRIRFDSLFSPKVVFCGHCLATLSLTINETLKWLSSFPS